MKIKLSDGGGSTWYTARALVNAGYRLTYMTYRLPLGQNRWYGDCIIASGKDGHFVLLNADNGLLAMEPTNQLYIASGSDVYVAQAILAGEFKP